MSSFLLNVFALLSNVYLLMCYPITVVTASSLTSSSSSSSSKSSGMNGYSTKRRSLLSDQDSLEKLSLHGIKPDKFVSAAPLVVAAVCRDGVAIVATHNFKYYNDDGDDDVSRMALDAAADADTTDSAKASDSSSNDDKHDNDDDDDDTTTIWNLTTLRDIPYYYRGPFRIRSVDGRGTTLACAGWRTDGEKLASVLRSFAGDEQEVFGDPSSSTSSGYSGGASESLQYGHYLAEQASMWMAKCAVSNNQRALSCVGLLATSARDEQKDKCGLWLLDATGAYRVRAHAIGLGANLINRRLRTMDFSNLTKEETVFRLLETMAKEASDGEQRWQEKQGIASKLPIDPDVRVEVAVVAPLQRTMNRMRLSQLISDSRKMA